MDRQHRSGRRPGRGRRHQMGWRRATTAVVATAVAGVTFAACSSPSSTSSVASLPGHTADSVAGGPLTQAQSDHAMVQFAQCLRAHGVAEPDPVHRPGHSGLSVQIPTPGPGTNSALDACNHFLTPLIQMKESHARQQLASWLPALTHYAECMRTHDIPMLDPGSEGQLNLGSVPGITNDFGRYSPQFRSADSACRHLLPSAVHDDGTGP